MTINPTGPLLAAGQVQGMAARETNQKLAIAMSVLSVALVGTMVFKELSHCMRERLRDVDRDFEDRRRSDVGPRSR